MLFVAEAMTLAHVVRLVTLADAMHDSGAQVWLATDPRYSRYIGPLRYPVETLRSLPAAEFFRALSTGARIFSFETLARYAKEDLALFSRLKPDAVVGDFRLSLGTSARHAGVPFINLTNAYWSPRARVRHIVPEYRWVSWLGHRLAQALFVSFRKLGFAHHASPVNRLRRSYGLPSLGNDFGRLLIDGDFTCFADSPQVVPMDRLEVNQRFIGPVPWSPKVTLPPWWEKMRHEGETVPLVYVNLGSSGPPEVLQRVLDAVESLPLRVVAATPDQSARLRPTANARIAGLVPGDEACRLAKVVVCNGGSPATYQAFAHGIPVIGIATNMDQFLNMGAVEDSGHGRLLRSGGLKAAAIRDAVIRSLGDSELHRRTRKLSEELAAAPSSSSQFQAACRSLVGR